jgi:hypothetical protein
MSPHKFSNVLDEVAADFIPGDLNLLPKLVPVAGNGSHKFSLKSHSVWTILIVVLALFLITGVVYAIGRSLGYIPGFGLVERGSSIRVLAEPAISTRDGVSVAVINAYLSDDRTSMEYQVYGVPHGAYPESEAVSGCIKSAYLQLPDGMTMDLSQAMPPIPLNVNVAVFVLPCVFNTLPGTVPENWMIPVRFIPAPADLTVVPVIEIVPSPSPESTSSISETANPDALEISKVLDIGTTYVIMGMQKYDVTKDTQFPPGSWWVDRGIQVTDANGASVPLSYPQDIEMTVVPEGENWTPWNFEIDKTTAFPITIENRGTVINPVGAAEKASFEFETGNDLSAGKEWEINKDFSLGGHSLHLEKASFDPRGGFAFFFTSDPGAGNNSIQMEIEGFTELCGGGGEGPLDPNITSFTRGICVADTSTAPHGLLKVNLTFQNLERTDKVFRSQWAPGKEAVEEFTATRIPGVCLDRASLPQVPELQNELQGKVFTQQLMAGGDSWETLLSDLQGNSLVHLGKNTNWPAFLPDGQRISYFNQSSLHLLDLQSGNDHLLPGLNVGAFNLQWSPDGSKVAYAAAGNDIYVSNSDGTGLRQLTNNADYKTLVGWEQDGKAIYSTAPGLNGWVLRRIELNSGETKDLFTLQDASLKAPDVSISPDGQWFAYRDKELRSLYLVRKDGTELHKVVDRAGNGITKGYWSADGRWITVGVLNSDDQKNSILIIQPGSCQVYLLPNIDGWLEGAQIK